MPLVLCSAYVDVPVHRIGKEETRNRQPKQWTIQVALKEWSCVAIRTNRKRGYEESVASGSVAFFFSNAV